MVATLTEDAQLFFALLAVVTLAAAVATLVDLAAVGVRSVATTFAGSELWAGSAVAAVTAAGSLYFSEIANYMPCKLCWLQRICLYPLAVILPIAALRKDRSVWMYVLPLSGIGAGISTWHWLVERVDALAGAGSCDINNPCTVIWFEKFGFVTLAMMALAAQLAIIALMLAARTNNKTGIDPTLNTQETHT